MKTGIYMIYCTETGKPYIGKAKDIDERKLQHFSRLKNCSHPCEKMQHDFNEYGEESFKFSILEECEESKLNHLEDYYILSYNAISRGYNSKRGDILSLTENEFSDKGHEANSWDNIVSDFKTYINSRDYIGFDILCLQSYVFGLNELYGLNKNYEDYLKYIIGNTTKFFIIKNTLSGKEKVYVLKDNLQKVYHKIFVYVENPIIPKTFFEYRTEIHKALINHSLELIDAFVFDEKSPFDFKNDFNLKKEIAMLELPYENMKNRSWNDYNTLCNWVIKSYNKLNRDWATIVILGIEKFEECFEENILNEILHTNYKLELDEIEI